MTKKIIKEGIAVGLIISGIIWISSHFLHFGKVEYTDNAQVRQQIIPINSRVQGFIKKICFQDYQTVKKGDPLIIIDDSEYRLRLAQAESDYQKAIVGKTVIRTVVSTTQNNLSASDAALEETHALLEKAKSDYERYTILLKQDAVSPQQYESFKTAYDALNAKYKMQKSMKQSTALSNREQSQRLTQHEADIAVAKAAVELARLNLSYTVITAPCDGTVGRKAVNEGQLIQVGQSILSIVDTTDIWIIANYKESQIANIKEKMPVKISVDATDAHLTGIVTAISDATGAQYSVIPQENAAGNFIKIEQRIPVKISLTKENSAKELLRLRAGMNVECEVVY